MKWVTRARPKIDRLACPWLVTRFIDPAAEFLYVPAGEVLSVAQQTGAIPFDIEGVELGHHGDRCSFDAFIDKYRLDDPALARMAMVVRGADTGRPALVPESAGLLAISLGLAHNQPDDLALLAQAMVLYDALYSWAARGP